MKKNKVVIEVMEHDSNKKRDFVIRWNEGHDAIVLNEQEFIALKEAFRVWINIEGYSSQNFN